MDLKALAELKVDDVVEQLDELTVEQLNELRAIEAADSNRVTLIERIDAKLAEASKQETAPAAKSAPKASKVSKVADKPTDAPAEPAWLADDYTGPLTIDQAQARLAKRRAAAEAAG